jgi:hypothetical protein
MISCNRSASELFFQKRAKSHFSSVIAGEITTRREFERASRGGLMAVIYSSTVKESRMRCVLDAIDGSAGPATLEIGSASPVYWR